MIGTFTHRLDPIISLPALFSNSVSIREEKKKFKALQREVDKMAALMKEDDDDSDKSDEDEAQAEADAEAEEEAEAEVKSK